MQWPRLGPQGSLQAAGGLRLGDDTVEGYKSAIKTKRMGKRKERHRDTESQRVNEQMGVCEMGRRARRTATEDLAVGRCCWKRVCVLEWTAAAPAVGREECV